MYSLCIVIVFNNNWIRVRLDVIVYFVFFLFCYRIIIMNMLSEEIMVLLKYVLIIEIINFICVV